LIKIGIYDRDNKIILFVEDSGKGIEAQNVKLVFERVRQVFSRTSNFRQGAGLGPSISKAYAKLLKGNLTVTSEKNKGSTFFITLPIDLISTKSDHQKMKESIIMKFNKESLVLIVEDEYSNALYLETILNQMNLKTITVISGKVAIDICKNNKSIDLVLMDIRLPDITGYIATQEIKKIRKNLIVIAQTSYAMKSNMEEAFSSGCDDYISKPIRKEDLFNLLQKYMQ